MVDSILFVEPPKDYWFVMGEYLPPPTGLLILAAYVERELPDVRVDVLDCQAERRGWDGVEKRIESLAPSIVACSGFTCNAYACARVAEIAKSVSGNIVTILGGQHFSFTTEESLNDFREIDYIVRGEGEITLVELIRALRKGEDIDKVRGLSFRNKGNIVNTGPRPLIEDLDTLPYPAYHLVEDSVRKYHFKMMAGRNVTYMVMEGARGCAYKCRFCTQWNHWCGVFRTKSAKRIGDEIEYLSERFGGQFIWLTDDNFDYGSRGKALWHELRNRKFNTDVMLFFQARTDDVASNPDLVAKLRGVGNYWVMMGVEHNSESMLKEFKKGTKTSDACRAVKVLSDSEIFSHTMFVLGSRKDTAESIESLRRFSLEIGSDLSIYTVLTPFPGTDYQKVAREKGWIEDTNYANYDMAHAIMPTETLTRKQVQEELWVCYRERYGSLAQNIAGAMSRNKLKRSMYRHMAGQKVLKTLRSLI